MSTLASVIYYISSRERNASNMRESDCVKLGDAACSTHDPIQAKFWRIKIRDLQIDFSSNCTQAKVIKVR